MSRISPVSTRTRVRAYLRTRPGRRKLAAWVASLQPPEGNDAISPPPPVCPDVGEALKAAPSGAGEALRPVFIIDDDADAHYLLQRQISRLGLTAPMHHAMSGQEALAYLNACLREEKPFPCLMFLDIKMPGLSGFDVLEWMRERQLLGLVCVAMLSSSNSNGDIQRAMKLGAHTYVTKPPSKDVLLKLIDEAVRMQSRRAAPVNAGPMRVLIVEESASTRRSIRRLFELMGYEVMEAHDDQQAIELCREGAPEWVFLDLEAGGATRSLATLEKLRALAAETKVIVATADAQGAAAQAARAGGAAGVIAKPFTVDQVAAMMRHR